MKKKRFFFKKLITGLCLALFSAFILNAQTTITGSTDDLEVRSNGSSAWYGNSAHRVGGAGSGYDGASVHPFQLPTLNPGEEIVSASFSIEYTDLGNTPAGNVDLYGLPYRTTSGVSASTDFWQGSFGSDPNATALQDDFLTITTPVGTVTTNATGNDNLVDYINAQYAAGAQGGDYIFLRVNPDISDVANYRFWEVATANSSTKPILVVEIGTTADTQAPSVPSGLASSSITETSFTLSWNASTDNVGVTGYEVFKDGASIGTTASTSMSVTGLTASTTYSMKIRATDAAGNWSAQSSALNVTTADPPDTQAPSIPSGLASGSITETSFTLSWNASTDNVAVTGYEVFKDGASIGTTANTSISVTSLTTGVTYSMKIRATDAAGNWSAQSSALNVTTLVPTGNLALNKPISVSAYQDDSFGYKPGENLVDGDVSDDARWSASGFPQWAEIDLGTDYSLNEIKLYPYQNRAYQYIIEAKADGGSYSTIVDRSSNTEGADILADNVSGTARYVKITVSGLSGSTSTWVSLSELEVYGSTGGGSDTQAPSVPTGLAAGTITTNSVALSWNASTDNVGVTGYKVYTNGSNPVSVTGTSATITGLSASTQYSFTVSAIDAASNESAQSSAIQATTATPPDTQAPSVPTGLTAGTITSSSVALSWNASTDNVGVTGYKVYTNGSNPVSVTGTSATITGLSASTQYSFTVSAIDAASNESAQSSSVNATTSAASGITSSAAWQSFTVSTETGVFTATFDAIPNGNNIDALTGILNGSASAYGDVACIIRFYTNGQIDARNGGSYSADNVINYTSGTSYHFRVEISVSTHTYSVYVTPQGSSEQTLASNFAFRSEQASVSQLTGWTLYASSGSHTVSNMVFTPAAPDTEAPSAPTNLVSSNIYSTGFTLSWTASTDNVGVTGYEVFRNGVSVGTTTTTSMPVTGLTASTTYSMTVKARDAVPNWSASSSALNVTTSASGGDDWPTLATTGPSGTLTSHSGDITANTNGQVIQNLNISGKISIKANNVTIRNCKFGALDIASADSYTGCVVEDCELTWAGRQNFTLRRCYMTGQSVDLIRVGGPNITIEDCFLFVTGPRIGDAHSDVIQEYPVGTGANLVVRHNRLYNEMNQTSIVISATDMLFENNLAAGGGYTIYANSGQRIINNHFSTIFFPSCGGFGVMTGTPGVCTGNVWHETGAPLNCGSSGEIELTIENAESGIKIYPNPLNGNVLNIQLTSYETDMITVNIFDLTGRSVYNQLHEAQSVLNISIDDLVKGIYIVSVNGEQQKLIVE